MRNLCCKCPHYYEQHGYECDDVDWNKIDFDDWVLTMKED